MHIIRVIPLTSLPQHAPQVLSYFYIQPLPKGAVVEIEIGTRKVLGIVLSSSSLEKEKMIIRKSSFQLKKLAGVKSEQSRVSPEHIKFAFWLARTYRTSLGLCLKAVLPSYFKVKKYDLEIPASEYEERGKNVPSRRILLEYASNMRISLDVIIKRTVARKGQVLIIAPDISMARFFFRTFDDQYKCVFINSKLSNSALFKAHRTSATGKAQIIVGTRLALFAPLLRLRSIIVLDPSDEMYKSDTAPYLNTPNAARFLADMHGSELVYATALFDTEQYSDIRLKNMGLQDRRKQNRPLLSIVDAIQEMRTGNFTMFSRELQSVLIEGLRERSKILLYSARKAYSGILLCKNCGTTAMCENCSIPLRTHRFSEEWMLVCYHCAAYQAPPKACPNCSGIQLVAAGTAGSQKIAEAMKILAKENNMNDYPIYILDADLARSEAQKQDCMKEFDENSRGTLVATQMILRQRFERTFDIVAIPNADALLSNPDFRTEERFAIQIEKLLDFAPNRCVVQTYNATTPIFQAIQSGQYTPFYDSELEARKSLSYPPFSRLIKLTFRHKNEQKASLSARRTSQILRDVIMRYNLNNIASITGPSPAFIAKEYGVYSYHILLKVTPDTEAADIILRHVPSSWRIDPDPRNIG